MAADYVSGLIGLASMVAQALAHKKKIQQEKSDTKADARYDIAMQNAAALGAPGASYTAQAHNALVHNHRLDREPVDYGKALGLLGHSIPSLGGSSSGNGGAGQTPAVSSALSAPLPNSQLDYTPQLPAADKPIYDYGGASSDAMGAPLYQPQLTAPDWKSLNLDDLQE